MKHSDAHSSAKALVAFLVLAIAFTFYGIFMKQGQDLANIGQLTLFKVLAILGGMALLILLFLVNNSKHTPRAAVRSSRPSKSKKKK